VSDNSSKHLTGKRSATSGGCITHPDTMTERVQMKNKEEYYESLWVCIKSEQLTARQIQEHLEDEGFKKWLDERKANEDRRKN